MGTIRAQEATNSAQGRSALLPQSEGANHVEKVPMQSHDFSNASNSIASLTTLMIVALISNLDVLFLPTSLQKKAVTCGAYSNGTRNTAGSAQSKIAHHHVVHCMEKQVPILHSYHPYQSGHNHAKVRHCLFSAADNIANDNNF